MSGNPNSPHWCMKPIELEELIELIELVRDTHRSESGVASITWNRIRRIKRKKNL